jgi:hypothetical protein
VSLRDTLIERLVHEIEHRIEVEQAVKAAELEAAHYESGLQAALNENAQLRKRNEELLETLQATLGQACCPK